MNWAPKAELCRPGDPRCSQVWSEHGGWEGDPDTEEVFVVIGQLTDDVKCERLARRFGLNPADLIAFRDCKIPQQR